MSDRRTLQAFVESRAEDPAAVSARGVARESLESGRGLASLRRLRCFEITGILPDVAAAADLLHRSTQFYNPSKERCSVRMEAGASGPFRAEEQLVLVFERCGERRAAAERWWRHETGERVEVREGMVWALQIDGPGAAAAAASLAVTTDRRHGLLANPHVEEVRCATGDAVPLPWISPGKPARATTRRRRKDGDA